MKIKHTLLILLILMQNNLYGQEQYTWENLFDRALRLNASLAEGEEAAQAARYKWKSSRRDRGPELFFESDLSYLTSPREVDLARGSLYEGGPLAPGLDFPPLPESDISMPLSGNQWYSFRLVLEQPLITSGKLSAQEKIYRSLWENTELENSHNRIMIKAEILTIVHSLVYLQEILNLIGEQQSAAERFVSLTRTSYDTGMTSYSDFLGAQVKAREVNLTENQVRKQQNQALLHLEYLCGLDDIDPEQISREGLPPLTENLKKDELLGEAVMFSPVLKMLRESIEISIQNKKLTQGSSYGRPDLGFQVELDYAGDTIPFTGDEWSVTDNNLTASVGIRALLGDFGKAAALVNEADSRIAEAEHRYRDQLEQMERSIGEELFNLDLNRENMDYYRSRAEDDLSMARQRKEYWEAGYGLEQDYLIQMISWYSDLIYEKQEMISQTVSYYKLSALTGKNIK